MAGFLSRGGGLCCLWACLVALSVLLMPRFAPVEDSAALSPAESTPKNANMPLQPASPSTNGGFFYYRFASRIFRNRSLGQPRQRAQCGFPKAPYSAVRVPGPPQPLHFTPARAWEPPSSSEGLVVLLFGGRGGSKFNAQAQLLIFARRWPSWHEHFLVPQGLTLVILLDREAQISVSYVVMKLGLRPVSPGTPGEILGGRYPYGNVSELDEGYGLHVYSGADGTRRTYVLLGSLWLDVPLWVHDYGRKRFEMKKMKGWRVHSTCTPITAYFSYVQTNRFYTHQLFFLRILDLFDFWVKVDADIQFITPLPFNMVSTMTERRALVVHSGIIPLLSACTVNIGIMVETYCALQSERCGHTVLPVAGSRIWFQNESLGAHGNLFGGWLGYHQSPEFLDMARFFNIFPRGLWNYRWTDQEMWLKAFGLFADEVDWLDLTAWRDHVFVHHLFVTNITAYFEYMQANNWIFPHPGVFVSWAV